MNWSKIFSTRESGLRFDRNELSGAFGDIGTDFPLIVGLILVCKLDAASVLIMFGLMQVITGIVYKIPMPVQPLKVMAVIMITQKLDVNILYGGGLAIGIIMFVLTATGLINWIANIVPKSVVRGIQLGLGLKLASLALGDYVQADGIVGYVLAAVAFVLIVSLLRNKKCPPAIPVIALGVVYALIVKFDPSMLQQGVEFRLPHIHKPVLQDILMGLVVLALPQLPLSIGNSVLATRQITEDLFPDKPISIRKIGWTYSLMNLINPFFSGIPTCHGSGGIAGHYTFGARTGGSVIIYGSLYLITGLFLGRIFQNIVVIFPLSILGVILLFEGLTLMKLSRDMAGSKSDFTIVLIVGLMAFGLPYGYVIGLVIGTVLARLIDRNMTGLAEESR